jgi:hypothetical protein
MSDGDRIGKGSRPLFARRLRCGISTVLERHKRLENSTARIGFRKRSCIYQAGCSSREVRFGNFDGAVETDLLLVRGTTANCTKVESTPEQQIPRADSSKVYSRHSVSGFQPCHLRRRFPGPSASAGMWPGLRPTSYIPIRTLLQASLRMTKKDRHRLSAKEDSF